MRIRTASLLTVALILIPAGLLAQADADAGEASAQETVEDVRAAIDRVFEGMREADRAKVAAVFAPGARFSSLGQGDEPGVVYREIDGWLDAIARSEGRWDERLSDVRIEVDGAMASAWTPYRFYLDGALRHCGVNSIELLRTSDGWKITQLSDTRWTEGCEEAE